MGSISRKWLHTKIHHKVGEDGDLLTLRLGFGANADELCANGSRDEQSLEMAENLVETSSMALVSDQVKKTQEHMSSSRAAGIMDDFQLLPSSFAAKHSDREANNDPFYPPSFEPQMLGEQDKMPSSTMDVQPQVLSDERSRSGIRDVCEKESKLRSNKKLEGRNGGRRITRSCTKNSDTMEKIAVETWTVGKKLGMYVENEEAVIKALSIGDTPKESARPRKRGRPRKTDQ